jgi:hypothetical protein
MLSPVNAIPVIFTREQTIRYGIEKWNNQPGQLWDITASLNEKGWHEFLAREAEIFNGEWLLKEPGPFKRLASLMIGCQYFEVFNLVSTKGETVDPTMWVPRLAVWLLPFLAPSLVVKGHKMELIVAAPTAHYQVDFVGYLRSVHAIVKESPDIRDELGLNTERIITVGLILEASTYASTAGVESLKEFLTTAENCVGNTDAPHKKELDIDLQFNSSKFLRLALGDFD